LGRESRIFAVNDLNQQNLKLAETNLQAFVLLLFQNLLIKLYTEDGLTGIGYRGEMGAQNNHQLLLHQTIRKNHLKINAHKNLSERE